MDLNDPSRIGVLQHVSYTALVLSFTNILSKLVKIPVYKNSRIFIKRNMQMKRGESAKIQFVFLQLKIPSAGRIFHNCGKHFRASFWLRQP